MATVILQAAGAAFGGLFGSTLGAIGSAVGAVAGYVADRALLTPTRRLEGPRLGEQRPFTAEEGAALPRIYGSVRVSGTVIWATRFEEEKETRRQGGKGGGGGGTEVTEYSYYANAAFALCEGPIAGVRRIWADGVELDREKVELRIHRGGETQDADPLIAVKQGGADTPAYRGTAYAVIERMPIGSYGNRLPQLQFEVLRPVGLLHHKLRAVTLIPGSTEYGLAPEVVKRDKRQGEGEELNRHVLHAGSDMVAALDELQMLCPTLEHVALVVSWFGDDLRADHCRIKPAVTTRDAGGLSEPWRVSGTDRAGAHLVSTHNGGAAFGGTPTDRSVKQAIAEMRSRGLKVTLYPFIMMDVSAGNSLPDPYGAERQASYPWRGRITVSPAPDFSGTPDKTAAARAAVTDFLGDAAIGDFDADDDTVRFDGDDWGYRRLVLHYARLAAEAGGVDAFLIGSELRGLSTLRDEAGAFPFVEGLCALAADARSVLGADTKITYGADWSEYFGYHPDDGSGDVLFHLDALWAHPAIDAVGIDNYMPLADWRDGDYADPNPDGAAIPCDPAALRAAVAGGEGFEWFYSDEAARRIRARQAITDDAYDKPWVFRFKDLHGWWSHRHYHRIGGVEQSGHTAWAPRAKPFWFTELGCPAIDKGPNQPNVFSDPKSAESAIPYFSNGGRSDLPQRRFLEAHLRWWDEDDSGFDEAANPLSDVYGGRMVDAARIYVWAWDARPFPAFPLRSDVWSDSANWQLGHWLNGRLEAPAAGDLVNAVLDDHGLPSADVDGAEGAAQGYVVDPSSPRDALAPILETFGLDLFERSGRFVVRSHRAGGTVTDLDALVVAEKGATLETTRSPDHDLPAQAFLSFRDAMADYQSASARSVWFDAAGVRQGQVAFPGVLDGSAAEALIDEWLRGKWSERESVRFSLPPQVAVEPGMLVRVAGKGDRLFRVSEVETGLAQQVMAGQAQRNLPAVQRLALPSPPPAAPRIVGPPLMLLLDLPTATAGRPSEEQFRVALWQRPWLPQVVYASGEDSFYAQRATVGRAANAGALLEDLAAGPSGRWNRARAIRVELFDGEAASAGRTAVLNGANALAILSRSGVWEVAQFRQAEEVSPDVFLLSDLLRGQLGTEDAAKSGAAAGTSVVLLDATVVPAGLLPGEAGLTLNWRAGPVGFDFSNRYFARRSAEGGIRAKLPLAPVHLRAKRASGGSLLFTWIRRSRIDADAWGEGEIPLGEENEEYLVEIAPAGGPTVRSTNTGASEWTWSAAAQAADFPVLPGLVDLTVRQRGTGVGWGLPGQASFDLGALPG